MKHTYLLPSIGWLRITKSSGRWRSVNNKSGMIYCLLFTVCSFLTTNCTSHRKNMQSSGTFTPQYIPGPHAMVYKTKANYDKLVPVELSDDKKQITSYPAPTDIVSSINGYAYPTPLHNGYLLDNRGIGKNAAFLKMTYEEYAKLSEAPTQKELFGMIIDNNPLTELIDCGTKTAFTDINAQINRLIDNGTLRSACKTIK